MALIFQYGSNCLESQINSKDRLCGDAKFITIAKTVEDFQLAFDVWSTNRQCAASDIVTTPGNKVWGALYEVPDFLIERKTAAAYHRKSIDAIEGAGANYKRKTIAVRRADGPIVTAFTYRVQNPKPDLKTNLEYVGYIVKGLRERGVRADYIEHVKKIAQQITRRSPHRCRNSKCISHLQWAEVASAHHFPEILYTFPTVSRSSAILMCCPPSRIRQRLRWSSC